MKSYRLTSYAHALALALTIVSQGEVLKAAPAFQYSFGGANLTSPTQIAVKSQDVLVGDFTAGGGVKVFDTNGNFKTTFATGNSSANGVSVLSSGTIYVVNANVPQVEVYTGYTAAPNSVFGNGFLGAGSTFITNHMDSNSIGSRLYVAGGNAAPVMQFNQDGSFIVTAGGIPGFSGGGVVVNNGTIYVGDSGHNRIQIFNNDATLSPASFFGNFAGTGPGGLALGAQGLYAVDTGANQVQIYDPVTRTFKSAFGSGQMNAPYGIFVENTTGRIFVTDATNHAVQVWFDPNEWTQAGTASYQTFTLDQGVALFLKDGQILETVQTVLSNGSVLGFLAEQFKAQSVTFDGGTLNILGDATLNTTTIINTLATYQVAPQAVFNLVGDILSGAQNVVLRFQGAGLTIWNGVGNVSGSVQVEEGAKLALNNCTLTTPTVGIASAGGVQGSGSINGNVISNGSVKGGNSIGTLNITGNYTMGPTAKYITELGLQNGAAVASLLNVGGVATITGALEVLSGLSRAQLSNKTFTILTAAGGVQGTFSQIPAFPIFVKYLSNAIEVFIPYPDFVSSLSPKASSNDVAAARYLNPIYANAQPGTDLDTVGNALVALADAVSLAPTPAAQADARTNFTRAIDQIQPSSLDTAGLVGYWSANLVSTSLGAQMELLLQKAADEIWVCSSRAQTIPAAGVGFASSGIESVSPTRWAQFNSLVGKRRSLAINPHQAHHPMRAKKRSLVETYETQAHTSPVSQRIQIGKANIWLQNYGLLQSMQSSAHAPGYKAQMGGFSAGGDYEIMPRFFVGTFAGLSTTPYDLKSHRGDGGLKSYYGGVYGVKMMDCGLYVDGQVMAGGDRYHTKRKIDFSTIHRIAKANHNGGHLFTKAEIGQIVPLSQMICVPSQYDVMLQPFVNMAYALNHEGGFREKGANSLDFKIKSRNSNFLRSEGGLLIYKTFMVCDALLRPEFSVSYLNTSRVGGGRGKVKGGLVGEPQTLIVRGDKHTINQVAPELGLTTQLKNGAYILANVRGELGSRLNNLSGVVTLGYNF